MMTLTLWYVAAYLLGAIPTSLLVSRLIAGVDLTTRGSGNLGATNVFRILGWKYAVPVGLIDVAKGTVPVVLFAPRAGEAEWIPVTLGLVAIVGHVFSVFAKFKGGKGVATAAGVVLGLAPLQLGIAAAVWALTVWLTGYVSLGSMLGAVAFTVSVAVLAPQNLLLLAVGIGISAFIVFTHRSNIKRLLQGTESRFGRRGGGPGGSQPT
ncbi:MAG: glycerol-3-phosphate 1-O-acyltransferase PlsY [Gemmatimonadales bacterium]